MSIFASSVPHPNSSMLLITESMVMYDKEQSDFGMPSLMLWSVGCHKSMMSLHLFGWWCFVMTPNLLMCMLGAQEV